MFLIPLFLLIAFGVFVVFKLGRESILVPIATVIIVAIGFFAIYSLDQYVQSSDTEVWSGKVVDWSHDEEWEEWIPPQTTCTSDAKGNQSCTTTPGYYVHHDAENHIKTTDNGWVSVSKSPDGRKFDDNYPNDVGPLKEYWKKDTPTASAHSYKNPVQASYSVYRHKDIDLNDYKDLPEYPDKVRDFIHVDRIIGSVPNKKEAMVALAESNTYMNKTIKGEDGKKRSWKQVNLIFVNVGENKPEDYGFALQDKWENGNKNDFVVSFSMDKEGKLKWVYPFSWSESERLKIDVREALMQKEEIKDFKPIVKEVSDLVIDKYERKEFADFDYLSIDVSTPAEVFMWLISLVGAIVLWRYYDNNKSYNWR